ncbi:hypothetical protein LX36DRAFT_77044 [Colletotrichum falcatum]|nr:hypothetical protein LX36DRAFT_77044 [Colletotrichum falcatum]
MGYCRRRERHFGRAWTSHWSYFRDGPAGGGVTSCGWSFSPHLERNAPGVWCLKAEIGERVSSFQYFANLLLLYF